MKKILFIIFIFIPLTQALAAARIDITKGNIDPLPIAINDLGTNDFKNQELAKTITMVIIADLERSGLFRAIDSQAFIQKLNNASIKPEFASWRQINAVAVFAGDLSETESGNLKVNFKVWDNYTEQQIGGTTFIIHQSNWRKLAHKIADEIYTSLTGESGYFNSKITYIEESGNPYKKTKKIVVMDQDGANPFYITDGRDLVLTPRFSPDSRKIIYLSYRSKHPRVYIYDMVNKAHVLVGEFPGMSFAPRFSPDGRSAVMAVASNGNSDIYIINLQTMHQIKLTHGTYIDTSPYFSPDGKKIIFSSDRSGTSNLYIMNVDGSNQERISFGKGSYYTPVWSPRGDYIAFTKILNGNFHIGVMRTDGEGERILTEGYMVEGPNWSPNGRIIIYTRGEKNTRSRLGQSKLQTIDLSGYHERDFFTHAEASDPAWSNLLD